ncbi:NAD(P)-dependent oxidoreductase [Paraburkholderia sediminicola]|uniref:NAD(P)-dependent oxidoreductase n=1 Tax=Paraburkholderia sediminicola TaxID=458836 RepID=UPI0038B7FA31
MKIAIIGITGRVGSRIASELRTRKHHLSGVARSLDPTVVQHDGFSLQPGDTSQPAVLAQQLSGHDVVVSAARFATARASDVIAAVKKAGVPRLVVVGGAASLEVAPGQLLLDAPDFPEIYKEEARAGLLFLETLRAERTLDWTFLSPPLVFEPGQRTSAFRLGGDELLVDADGKSWISMEDYAIALVDEIETPRHSRRRFTVGN